KKKTVSEVAIRKFPVLYLDSEIEEVPEFDYAFLPVIDSHNKYKGVITSDQLLKIFYKQISELKIINYELEEIIENSHFGFCVFDKNGIGIKANKATERLTGLKRSELIEVSARKMEEKKIFNESVTLKVLKKKKPVTITQVYYTGKECIVTGFPIFNKNKEIIKVATNIFNITELNRIKEKLKQLKRLDIRYPQEFNQPMGTKLFKDVIFISKKMQDIMDLVFRLSQVDSTVLIYGESGVGKEVIANILHESSKRRSGGPFIKINCAAIPEQLLESELFGYEGGAFTGARQEGKAGVLELADKGTLFLDEIAELSGFLQAKLLRVLQDKEFIRLGGTKLIKVDIQIIAATNKDLALLVKQNKFREDLFFRLNVIPITVPPLRERKEDILPLIMYYLQMFNSRYNWKKTIAPEALDVLINYHWPGNVRELANIIERVTVASQSDTITIQDLPKHICINKSTYTLNEKVSNLQQVLEEIEKSMVLEAIKTYGNTYKAAEALGISQPTFFRKLRKYQS
ncbi:MAG: sigma 54-interacting transcriptional regulator, partial [Spirochaetota bacterium]